MDISITDICKKQFFMSLDMMLKLPAHCPEKLWYKKKNGIAFWHILLHALSGIDYWMRIHPGELREFSEYIAEIFPGRLLYPDFEQKQKHTLSKEEITQYSERIRITCENYFKILNHKLLTQKSVLSDSFTNLDILLLLMRHIQYHTGQCNTILKENNQKTVAWIE